MCHWSINLFSMSSKSYVNIRAKKQFTQEKTTSQKRQKTSEKNAVSVQTSWSALSTVDATSKVSHG